jgi:hypothetical protein
MEERKPHERLGYQLIAEGLRELLIMAYGGDPVAGSAGEQVAEE